MKWTISQEILFIKLSNPFIRTKQSTSVANDMNNFARNSIYKNIKLIYKNIIFWDLDQNACVIIKKAILITAYKEKRRRRLNGNYIQGKKKKKN